MGRKVFSGSTLTTRDFYVETRSAFGRISIVWGNGKFLSDFFIKNIPQKLVFTPDRILAVNLVEQAILAALHAQPPMISLSTAVLLLCNCVYTDFFISLCYLTL